MKRPAIWLVSLALLLGQTLFAGASRPLPYDEGSTGLAFALRKLPVTGSFLHTAAHPDDEDNPLLVLLGKGRGLRTALYTLTRGEGGQNEIGPELFEALGIIRTEELMAMHRYDGARQYFSAAYEFGYSFSVEETLDKWGKEETLSDMVRVIRKFRPDVIVSLPRQGEGGGQHHQTSARLTEEAFFAAADPARFPEQIAQGYPAWQARKLYERHRWQSNQEPDPDAVRIETGIFDPLYGRTYVEIGLEARSLHRCQGMGQLIPPPGPRASYWKLVASAEPIVPGEQDLFEGIDTSLFAIEGHAPSWPTLAPNLHTHLTRIADLAGQAQRLFDPADPALTAAPLAAGLGSVRSLRERIAESALPEQEKYQADFLLARKEEDFEKALHLALQIRLETVAETGLVIPGQEFEVSAVVANGGSMTPGASTLTIEVPDGWEVDPPSKQLDAMLPGGAVRESFKMRVAAEAAPTRPYWRREDPTIDRYQVDPRHADQPWAEPEVRISLGYTFAAIRAELTETVQHRYEGPWVGGEQRHDVMVVPAVSLSVTPEVNVLPRQDLPQGKEIRVSALYNGSEPVRGTLSLELPEGWLSEPSEQAITLSRKGESKTSIFRVRPPGGANPGEYRIGAEGRFHDRTYREGYQSIDYDHIQRRHLYHPAATALHVVDVEVEPVRLAYIDGVGDRVPEALQQLGVAFDFLDEDDLAFADLDRYDTIVTGVRAYLVRDDLKSHNDRLLEWVKRGGVLIVQYNKFEFNDRGRGDSPYAPYPIKVGRGRVTDEYAPIQLLAEAHPVFHYPNRIGSQDWKGWVQERGLYFIGEKNAEYRDLISTQDPFEYNAGEKLGSLVEADYGEGKWIYVGLGLWRQLPAGVTGAYRLLANLISLPKTRKKAAETVTQGEGRER